MAQRRGASFSALGRAGKERRHFPEEMTEMRCITRFLALLALIALAGCAGDSGGGGPSGGNQGGDNEESSVRFVVADLQAASRDGDGDRICNQIFTPKLADSVTSASKSGSCAKEVRENLFDPRERLVVEDVEVVDPTTATAIVKESNGKPSKVSLVKQGGEWRIRGVQPA